uniref:Glutamyl-tRNA(Gln) amidotransferase subunit A, mitochondrial n=1 Tax=Bursaphelenchus xylophilus TaxID=6326 RepID=A0A1I7SBV4_BURXY
MKRDDVKEKVIMVNSILKAIEKASKSREFNSLITETFDLAKKQAEEHVKNGKRPFSVVIKDNFAVEDVKMTCASKMLENYIAPYTATIASRLFAAGGCLIGKANMDEFGMGSSSINSHFGPVGNPRDRERRENDFRVAGGSSGGSAVAIAEGFADVSIGSDTGGSTRNPASFCGVFGFKPSYGLMSRYGLVPLCNAFDTPSFFTHSAEDAQKYFEICLGKDPRDLTSLDLPPSTADDLPQSLKGIKIGIPKEFHNDYVSDDTLKLWRHAVSRLREAGAEVVEEVSLPNSPYSLSCYHILTASDVQSNMARYLAIFYGHRSESEGDSFQEMIARSRTEAFSPVVRRRIFAGNFFNLKENRGKYFLQAAKVRRLIQQDFQRAFGQVDALLVPSTSHSAPLFSEVLKKSLEEKRKDDFFTQSANLCGLPAISVPYGHCGLGFPIGMQLICDYLKDEKCIQLGKFLHDIR